MRIAKPRDGSWVGVVMLIVCGVFWLTTAVVSLMRRQAAVPAVFFLAMGCIPIVAVILILCWRRRKYGDGPTTDERERWIRLRGDSAGAMSFMIYWGLICIGPSLALTTQGEKTITLEHFWIPLIFVYGLVLQAIVRTIVIHHIRRHELTNDHE